MATFVCALCLKDIHGDPVWVNPAAAGNLEAVGPAADPAATCVTANLPDHAPFHAACAERAFPGMTGASERP